MQLGQSGQVSLFTRVAMQRLYQSQLHAKVRKNHGVLRDSVRNNSQEKILKVGPKGRVAVLLFLPPCYSCICLSIDFSVAAPAVQKVLSVRTADVHATAIPAGPARNATRLGRLLTSGSPGDTVDRRIPGP